MGYKLRDRFLRRVIAVFLPIYLRGLKNAFKKNSKNETGKENEINFFKNLNEQEQKDTIGRPFSMEFCGRDFTDMGQVFTLLPPPPAKLLDLGCGTGWTSGFFAMRGYDVTGADIAPDMIEAASKTHKMPNLKFLVMDYEGFSFGGGFDCVVFYDCLHHAEDEGKAIESAYRALSDGGCLLMVEPGTGHEAFEGSIYNVNKFGVTEKEMPPWKTIPSLKRAGFKTINIFPRSSILTEAFSTKKGVFGKMAKILLFMMKRHSGIVVAYK